MEINKNIENNKGMMKKTIISLILGMFLLIGMITGVSASDSLGTFKQNENVRITQVCSDATYINISSISYPNSTIAVSDIEMTPSGSGEFYYNFNKTSKIGTYQVRGISDGCSNTFATYFEIEKSHDNTFSLEGLDTTKSIIIFLIIFAIAGFLMYIRLFPFASLMIVINGFIMLVSDINIIISTIVIMFGVFISFLGRGE